MENFFQQAFGANPFPRFQGNAASPGGAFDNFFQNFQVPQHHQAQTDGAVPEASKAPPPASTKVLNELKEIVITADDLIEEGNRSCQICLEDQAPGGRGCKLPCGHLYCLACVRGWLARSCTCPACRFELPTDDAAYEGRRRRRMADRQLRYRPEELSAKPLRELTALCRQLGVPTAGVLEKRGLVDALLASGKIKILEETHVELSLPELQSKSIKELRKIMVDLGISFETCVEKSDMLAAIGRSPKVRLTVPVAAAAAECAAAAAATPPRLPEEAGREVGAEGGEAEAAGLPFGGGGGARVRGVAEDDERWGLEKTDA